MQGIVAASGSGRPAMKVPDAQKVTRLRLQETVQFRLKGKAPPEQAGQS